MEFIRKAFDAVQRNAVALVLYMVVIGLTSLVYYGVANLTMAETADTPENARTGVEIALSLFAIFATAFAQSVFFARMGKQIDRPLWKISGDLEAVKRFFPMWTGWNALVLAINLLAIRMFVLFEANAGVNLLFIVGALAAAVYIPVGTALMFLGNTEWRQMPEALKPLYRQFPKTLVIVMFGGFLFFLHFVLVLTTREPWWLVPMLDFAFAYFDCVIFAATWLLLMYDRQAPEEVDLGF